MVGVALLNFGLVFAASNHSSSMSYGYGYWIALAAGVCDIAGAVLGNYMIAYKPIA